MTGVDAEEHAVVLVGQVVDPAQEHGQGAVHLLIDKAHENRGQKESDEETVPGDDPVTDHRFDQRGRCSGPEPASGLVSGIRR